MAESPGGGVKIASPPFLYIWIGSSDRQDSSIAKLRENLSSFRVLALAEDGKALGPGVGPYGWNTKLKDFDALLIFETNRDTSRGLALDGLGRHVSSRWWTTVVINQLKQATRRSELALAHHNQLRRKAVAK